MTPQERVAMALQMHQVQFDRANRLQDEVANLRAELAAASTRFAAALDEQQARLEQAHKERRDALAKIARVEAVIAPMHEDWCRAKHDPGRECECIHAEIRKAIDGSET